LNIDVKVFLSERLEFKYRHFSHWFIAKSRGTFATSTLQV